MRKVLLVLLVITLSLTGCSARRSSDKPVKQEEQLYTTPSGFYKDYEKPVYSSYNSPASENGLAGSKIYLDGQFNEIHELESDGTLSYYTNIKDDNGNEWLLILETEGLGSKSSFEKLIEHPVTVTAIYDGFSGVYDLPVIYTVSIYDRKTGSIVTSKLTSTVFEDILNPVSEEPVAQTDPEPVAEPEPEPTTEPEPTPEVSNDTIRPEIKEAIDAYEAFIDEYIAFMTKYSESDNSATMLYDYMKFAAKYEEAVRKIDALEAELTDAEALYYYEVLNRCNMKMLESLN